MTTPSLRPPCSTIAIALAAALAALTAGCSDEEPVSHSAPIGINLKVKSSDVGAQATISSDKNITTESGNPWAKFVTDARSHLTHDPSDVDLDQVTLTLGATSTGVTSLAEIFTGEVVIQFVMETSNNIVPVAKLTNPTGGAGDDDAHRCLDLVARVVARDHEGDQGEAGAQSGHEDRGEAAQDDDPTGRSIGRARRTARSSGWATGAPSSHARRPRQGWRPRSSCRCS